MTPIELPDINVLIALADPAHTRHADAEAWFAGKTNSMWATCPFTENGLVRIISNPAYAALTYSVADSIAALRSLIQRQQQTHRFWPEDISICDTELFRSDSIRGPSQITDIYLLGLCQRHAGTLVTLDAKITNAAILSPRADLIRQL